MRALSARERKLVAVGLLIAVVTVMLSLVIAPIVAGFTGRAQRRVELREMFARNARMINAVPALRRSAERQASQASQFGLRAATPDLARDALRERLRRAFAAEGGEIVAVQDIPAGPGQVRAWVQGRMTLDKLERLLATLQATPPYLVVESLRVSADKALETGHLDILDIRVEASIPYLPAAS